LIKCTFVGKIKKSNTFAVVKCHTSPAQLTTRLAHHWFPKWILWNTGRASDECIYTQTVDSISKTKRSL